MISISRTRAENRFAAIEKRQQAVLNEREEAARALSANTARLKALRLAKEAADLANTPAKKSSSKKAPAKKPAAPKRAAKRFA